MAPFGDWRTAQKRPYATRVAALRRGEPPHARPRRRRRREGARTKVFFIFSAADPAAASRGPARRALLLVGPLVLEELDHVREGHGVREEPPHGLGEDGVVDQVVVHRRMPPRRLPVRGHLEPLRAALLPSPPARGGPSRRGRARARGRRSGARRARVTKRPSAGRGATRRPWFTKRCGSGRPTVSRLRRDESSGTARTFCSSRAFFSSSSVRI